MKSKIDLLNFAFVKYYMLVVILREVFLTVFNLYFNNHTYSYIDGIGLTVMITLFYLHFNFPYDYEKMGKVSCFFLFIFHLIYGAFSQNLVFFVFCNTFLFALGFYMFFDFKKTLLLTISTLLIFPLNAVVSLFYASKTRSYSYVVMIILEVFTLILFLVLLYYSTEIKKANAILEFQENKEKVSQETINIKKIESCDNNELYKALFYKVDTYMKEKMPWKNAEYNLEQLEKELDVASIQISTAIHYCTKNNFKTYLNDFRLHAFEEEVKKQDGESVLLKEIYLNIGFNSRVTFNRTFKNKFGKTPQEYVIDFLQTKD